MKSTTELLGAGVDGRHLRQASLELDSLRDRLSLPDKVVEETARMYLRALKRGLVRHRSIVSLMASSAYAACRHTGTPLNLKDVEGATSIKRKEIARCYRLLIQELDIKMPAADPVQFVERIAVKIGIAEKTRRHATDVLRQARRSEASAGKDPMGLAATAIYLACLRNGEGKSWRDVAEAADVTEVTIRNRYRGLVRSLEGEPDLPPRRARRRPAAR